DLDGRLGTLSVRKILFSARQRLLPLRGPCPPMATTGTANPLAGLKSRADVARFLRTSTAQLWILLRARPPSQRYTQFTITKRRGGTRTILAPRNDLKILQRKLASQLTEVYRPRRVVYGFVAGRGITGNADRHLCHRHVLNVDLKDFFPSINFGRVYGLFQSL